jgi:DNA-binding NtrC family response regulator
LPATGQKTAPIAAQRSTIKILYAESEEKALATQTAEMTKIGHQVTTAVGRRAVQEALNGIAFDLVILGPTVSKEDRHHLPYMVKKAHQGTKVLVMHAGTHHHEVDGSVDPNISMSRILEKIAGMLQPTSAR